MNFHNAVANDLVYKYSPAASLSTSTLTIDSMLGVRLYILPSLKELVDCPRARIISELMGKKLLQPTQSLWLPAIAVAVVLATSQDGARVVSTSVSWATNVYWGQDGSPRLYSQPPPALGGCGLGFPGIGGDVPSGKNWVSRWIFFSSPVRPWNSTSVLRVYCQVCELCSQPKHCQGLNTGDVGPRKMANIGSLIHPVNLNDFERCRMIFFQCRGMPASEHVRGPESLLPNRHWVWCQV